MKIKRKFYAVKTADIPAADAWDINRMVDDFNDMFGDSEADWFDLETQFEVGELTVFVFRLSWPEEGLDDNLINPNGYGSGVRIDTHFSGVQVSDTDYVTTNKAGVAKDFRDHIRPYSDYDHDYDSWWF